jgi:hypothetical protein
MATSQLTIVNRALIAQGELPITSAQLTADTIKQARIANDVYAEVRAEKLAEHRWNWAEQTVRLNRTWGYDTDNDAADITAATKANPVVLTLSSNPGYATGDNVLVDNVGGMTELNGNVYRLTSVASTSITLAGVDGRNFTTYTSGGSIIKKSPIEKYQYGYSYDLPADLHVARELDGQDDMEWELIRDSDLRLWTADTDAAVLKYTAALTDPTVWSDAFTLVMVLSLAERMCPAICGIGSKGTKRLEKIERALMIAMAKAKYEDTQEQRKELPVNNRFLDARR